MTAMDKMGSASRTFFFKKRPVSLVFLSYFDAVLSTFNIGFSAVITCLSDNFSVTG